MWVDSQGVFHTISLPDPSELMTIEFRRCLDDLIQGLGGDLAQFIEKGQDSFFDRYANWRYSEVDESEFEELSPPSLILAGCPRSIDSLRTIVDLISARWRLDVWMALEDYLDRSL